MRRYSRIAAAGARVFEGDDLAGVLVTAVMRDPRAGVSYSLSVVLMLPFYVLLVCLLVEVVLLLNAQTGVDYASWAAARAAAVWVPAEAVKDGDRTLNVDMVRRAAVNALSVWAVASERGSDATASSGARALVAVSQAAEGKRAHAAGWVSSKWQAANRATRVEFAPPLDALPVGAAGECVELSVTVHYARPFFTPGVGRIFGRRTADGYVRDLQATTVITVEFPQTATGRLGWEYDSRPCEASDSGGTVGIWHRLF